MIVSEMVRGTKVAVIFMNFVLTSEEGKCKFVIVWKEKLQRKVSLPTSWQTPAEESVIHSLYYPSSVGSQGTW